jgi:hypothetical protein
MNLRIDLDVIFYHIHHHDPYQIKHPGSARFSLLFLRFSSLSYLGFEFRFNFALETLKICGFFFFSQKIRVSFFLTSAVLPCFGDLIRDRRPHYICSGDDII